MELDIFENEKIPSSRFLKEPPCSGQYLVVTSACYEKTQFQLVFYREDTKKFYMNLDCPVDKDLNGYWKMEVEEWILLKKLSLSDFEN